jgi:hypothetical protein
MKTNGAHMDCAEDDFLALLVAVCPYVDELVHQPTFHLFMDLPIEIRCLVYDQYLLDETKSVACRQWPYPEFTRTDMALIQHKRDTSPFLPNLCFTSKTLRTEILPYVLGIAHFKIDDCVALGHMLVSLYKSGLEIRCAMRKATLKDLNGQRNRFLLESDEVRLREAYELAARSNEMYALAIPCLPQLRELSITFYAPLMLMAPSWDKPQQDLLRALSIKDYLASFDSEKIFALDELQKLSITGFSGVCNKPDMIGRVDRVIDDGESDHLTAISDLARQMKEGFRARGRDVVVTARLQWAPSEYREERLQ